MKSLCSSLLAGAALAVCGCSDASLDLQVQVDLPPGTTIESADAVAKPLVIQAAAGLCGQVVDVHVSRYDVQEPAIGEETRIRAVGRFRCP